MNLFKKGALAFGSIVPVVAPIAAAVSCGSESSGEDMSKIITIQAEHGWVETYKEIIADFKKSKAALMKENGITDIRILESGSFDVEGKIKTNGIKDEEAVADTFLVAGDKLSFFLGQNALKPFKETSTQAFLDAQKSGYHWAGSANATRGLVDGKPKLYGIPENVEAMVGIHKKGVSGAKYITKFSDLWMAAGYFNEDGSAGHEFDLKDILSIDSNSGKVVLNEFTNSNGKVVAGVTTQPSGGSTLLAKLTDGFTRINAAIQAGNTAVGGSVTMDQEAFNLDSAKADPKVRAFFNNHADKIGLYDGPWNVSKIQKELNADVEAEAPTGTWNQFGGGWLYGMNARITTQEQNVIEPLLASFYDSKWATKLYNGAGKVSPVEEGKTELNTLPVPKAIYAATVISRPSSSAFNDAWTSYASTIDRHKVDMKTGAVAPATLAQEWITNLKAAIAKTNQG